MTAVVHGREPELESVSLPMGRRAPSTPRVRLLPLIRPAEVVHCETDDEDDVDTTNTAKARPQQGSTVEILVRSRQCPTCPGAEARMAMGAWYLAPGGRKCLCPPADLAWAVLTCSASSPNSGVLLTVVPHDLIIVAQVEVCA